MILNNRSEEFNYCFVVWWGGQCRAVGPSPPVACPSGPRVHWGALLVRTEWKWTHRWKSEHESRESENVVSEWKLATMMWCSKCMGERYWCTSFYKTSTVMKTSRQHRLDWDLGHNTSWLLDTLSESYLGNITPLLRPTAQRRACCGWGVILGWGFRLYWIYFRL